jgi:hypothetical protein
VHHHSRESHLDGPTTTVYELGTPRLQTPNRAIHHRLKLGSRDLANGQRQAKVPVTHFTLRLSLRTSEIEPYMHGSFHHVVVIARLPLMGHPLMHSQSSAFRKTLADALCV